MGFFLVSLTNHPFVCLCNCSEYLHMKTDQLYRLLQNHNINTDSRHVNQGDLFFALKGDRFNGNEFAGEAIEKGCAFAVIDEKAFVRNEKYLLVENVLLTLQDLAKIHRQNLKMPVVAITGTNGKTTTKELIKHVLLKQYNVSATRNNLNNHIGVPLTILDISPDSDIAVVEMGANHPGEIHTLCHIAHPTHGLITNIGKAHLEGFGSFNNICSAKAELYDYLEESRGTVFYNPENNDLQRLLKKKKMETIPYTDDKLDASEALESGADPFINLTLRYGSDQLPVRTKLAGTVNIENILAAVRVGDYFHVEIRKIIDAIENYQPENNRSQILHTKTNILLLDAYNANPTSMMAAIRDVGKKWTREAYLILGDMLELGKVAAEEHQEILSYLEEKNLRNVILVGSIFQSVNKNPLFKSFKDTVELIAWLKLNPIQYSDILIKGSRKMELERIINYL